jgi:cysteine desulfurase
LTNEYLTKMTEAVYLDHNATTPIKPDVLSLMTNVLAETGNASSIHSFGRAARKHVETARRQVAEMVGAKPNQVVFTSGATESNNTVLCAYRDQRVMISAIEHPSVFNVLPEAELIPVTKDGVVDLEKFKAMLNEGEAPSLISVMMVNNEIGTIQPIEEISRIAKEIHPDVQIHTDAVQAAGRININMPAMGVDYLSLSAHKMNGPQGIGALISGPGAKPVKMLCGGGQEKSMRAGTENVPAIAAFGKASELATTDMQDYQKLASLREKMEKKMKEIAPELIIFAENAPRVANTSAVSLPGTPAQTQVMFLDLEGIAVSSGSACSSGSVKQSPIASAMGITEEQMSGAFRISMGWGTTEKDIDRMLEAWSKMYKQVNNSNNQQLENA